MQLAGGRVSAHSDGVGQGAHFVLDLAGGAARSRSRERAASATPAADRVLVVEDDPHLAAGVVENLRAEGYEVDARRRRRAGARVAAARAAAG